MYPHRILLPACLQLPSAQHGSCQELVASRHCLTVVRQSHMPIYFIPDLLHIMEVVRHNCGLQPAQPRVPQPAQPAHMCMALCSSSQLLMGSNKASRVVQHDASTALVAPAPPPRSPCS